MTSVRQKRKLEVSTMVSSEAQRTQPRPYAWCSPEKKSWA